MSCSHRGDFMVKFHGKKGSKESKEYMAELRARKGSNPLTKLYRKIKKKLS